MLKILREKPHIPIYAMLFLLTAIPLLQPLGLPISVSRTTITFFDIIDDIEEGDIIFFDINFGPGSWPENGPQAVAVIKHIWAKGGKILFFSLNSDGPQMYDKIISQITPPDGYEYGVDWVYLGFLSGGETAMAALTTDTASLVQSDYLGKSLESLPLMQEVRSAEDAKLLICNTSGALAWAWVRQWHEPYNKPYLLLPIGIMVPSSAVYVDAGQIAALLPGSRGAAEYEIRSGIPGEAITLTDTLTVQQVYIMILIIIGNIMFLSERKGKSSENTRRTI
jgi:hypothetical protein